MTNTHEITIAPSIFDHLAADRLHFVTVPRRLFVRIEAEDEILMVERLPVVNITTTRTVRARILLVVSRLDMRGIHDDHLALSLEILDVRHGKPVEPLETEATL